ncbi:hypothetical protein WMY93_026690 [Mugilogobius chulae]|uniref:Uncharacterized protein n=1 Tax=Mugilogobius chulae TaxID=88201 RepID=A0AAW0MZ99_9GOBI
MGVTYCNAEREREKKTGTKDNVVFQSTPTAHLSSGAHFPQQVDKDGGEFKRKAGCQNITELFCDLTAETPAVYDVHYRAKVEADDVDYGQTIKFKPVAETVLGAPILSHSINSTSLSVDVELPLDTTESRSGHFVVNLKNAQREYCGYVEYKPAVEWGRPLSESTSFCVTQPDHSWLLWSILSVVALSVTVLVAACWAKHYVKPKSKKPLPSSLDIRKQPLSEVIMDPMDDHNICEPEISTNKHKEETPYLSSPVRPCLENSSSGESTESSVIYGGVALQENEDLQQLPIDPVQWISNGEAKWTLAFFLKTSTCWSVTMETSKMTLEEESSQMSQSMKVSSQKKKKTFTSSDEEPFLNTFPIISADVMSVKELLDIDTSHRHRTWDIMKDMAQAEYRRIKWTLFGNEAEKLERDVARTRHILRTRVDKIALRNQGEEKVAAHKSYLEALSRRTPDFIIPLRSHTVWEGMRVVFTCTVQGYPPPKITWFKDGVPLRCPHHPWNYTPKLKHGLCTLEIRRCSPADAGKYKVVAKSALGQATTFATLIVNSYQGATAGSERSQTSEPEAQFGCTFPPTWVTEGETLTLQCTFSSPLLPFQQDVCWFRDGVPLEQSKTLDIKTDSGLTRLTLEPMQKEFEGVYTVQLRTRSGTQEHSAFVYVKDGAAAVAGVRPHLWLSRKELSEEQWTCCNAHIQKNCHYPVFGLKPGAYYQFRVCAVNKAGAGRFSKPTDPILTADPQEAARKMVVSVDRGRTITVTKDELEGEVTAPLPPTDVHACEVTDTYVVLSWSEPDPRGREPSPTTWRGTCYDPSYNICLMWATRWHSVNLGPFYVEFACSHCVLPPGTPVYYN